MAIVRLRLRLIDRESWSKFYEAPDSREVFCPTSDPPQVGERVLLEVLFQKGPRLALHGTVLWRRPFGDTRARPGVGIQVDRTDIAKLVYLTAYVRGGLLDKRQRRRLPIRLPVAYAAGGGRRLNFTRDLHEEGLFVWCNEQLPPGEEARLRILPPSAGAKPFEVRGVVTYLQQEPNLGMGIQLAFSDPEARKTYIAFVSELEQKLVAGTLPDEALS